MFDINKRKCRNSAFSLSIVPQTYRTCIKLPPTSYDLLNLQCRCNAKFGVGDFVNLTLPLQGVVVISSAESLDSPSRIREQIYSYMTFNINGLGILTSRQLVSAPR